MLVPGSVHAGTLDETTDTYLTPFEGDGVAANVGLSFGSVTLQKLLYYDTANTAFTFTDSVNVQGDLGLTGIAKLSAHTDPSTPPADTLDIYSKAVAGRMLLKAKGPSGLDYPLQPSFFQNQVCMLSAGAGTTINSVGCSATNDTTLSVPTVTEGYGFMTNFATAATALDNAGTSSNVASFFRGSAPGANGFFYYARVGVVDAANVRLFSGLANQTIAVMTDADNPAGHYAGFQYTTARADTNWQFITKNNTTQTVADTGLAVTAANVYDTYMFCSPECSTIYWRIDNLTAGTSVEGSATATLPGTTTAMRGVIGIGAVAATAKSFRFQRMYIESDR